PDRFRQANHSSLIGVAETGATIDFYGCLFVPRGTWRNLFIASLHEAEWFNQFLEFRSSS
ncbi:hypothetical protein, partial [Stutzerimonas nitrititolerans]